VNVVRIVIIVVALGVAALTAFLVKNFLESQQAELQAKAPTVEAKPAPTVEVLLAERDMAAGTIASAKDFRWQPWPEGQTNANFIVKSGQADQLKQYEGAAVKRAIVAGEPILAGKLTRKAEGGFLPAVLAPGMRAVSLAVDAVSGASGFILPGALVDVILTETYSGAGATEGNGGNLKRVIGETILEAVRVIATDQTSDDLDETPKLSRTVTLEVTPKQAERLNVAKSMGTLSLSLRSIGNAPGGETDRSPTLDADVSTYLKSNLLVTARALVAAQDLPAGTLLTDPDMAWIAPPPGNPEKKNLVRDTEVKRSALRGAYLKRDIKAGEFVPVDSIIRPGEHGFITAALGPGMRAISVEVSQAVGVSGYIAPGDRVDVILTQQLSDLSQNKILDPRRVAETVATNVRVLSLEQTIDEQTGKPVLGQTATVEVTPKQAETLALAKEMGKLTLILRGAGAEPAEAAEAKRPFTTDLAVSRGTVDFLLNGTRNAPELSRNDRGGEGGGRVKLYRNATPENVTFN
jgi:pilus assembly protein CpaB